MLEINMQINDYILQYKCVNITEYSFKIAYHMKKRQHNLSSVYIYLTKFITDFNKIDIFMRLRVVISYRYN